jgi:hypothetical protein
MLLGTLVFVSGIRGFSAEQSKVQMKTLYHMESEELNTPLAPYVERTQHFGKDSTQSHFVFGSKKQMAPTGP